MRASLQGLLLTVVPLGSALPAAAQDLIMHKVTTPSWPNGLEIDWAIGPTWADFDADGWVDFFCARTMQLWRNVEGKDWEVTVLPHLPVAYRYGAAAADYDNDGLPDIATEPRLAEDLRLLRNDGNMTFTDMTFVPGIVDLPPYGDAETNTWVDVDFDGYIDLYVPTYGAGFGGAGTFFLHNQGPTGPGGEVAFLEVSAQVGIDEVPGTARPEGADWADYDRDGDADTFAGGSFFQNNSATGTPVFLDISDATGIVDRDRVDEGVFFFDMDLDGDDDVFVSYCTPKEPRVYENLGDGMLVRRPKNWFTAPPNSCVGTSYADFDNDGDIDIAVADRLYLNVFMETGQRRWVVASHTIPSGDLSGKTWAWADWNRDGDMDLVLGPTSGFGHLYENDLYGPDTPHAEKRHVRVRVVRDHPDVPDGLENEFGATIELFVHDEPGRLRRRKHVTSAGGYVNQNEYVRQFGLPPASDAEGEDWTFDLAVDFISDPTLGIHRIDRHVNPALGGIDLADLDDREIWVYRDGRVRVNGCEFQASGGAEPILTATTDGLAGITPGAGLPSPTDAPADSWHVGIELDTSLATEPQRVREVIVDGVLADLDLCTGDPARLTLWDVTDPNAPVLAETEQLGRYIRNDRGHYRTDLLLEPARRYRLVARVDSLRPTPVAAPVIDGPVTPHGGLSFQDTTPCDGTEVMAATVDSTQVYLSARFSVDTGSTWVDLGHAHPGTSGPASLAGTGAAVPGGTLTLSLADAPPQTMTVLVSSTSAYCRPMGGGVLIPAPDVITPVATDALGSWMLPVGLPSTLDPGTTFYFQAWWIDVTAEGLRAGSNAVSVTAPY